MFEGSVEASSSQDMATKPRLQIILPVAQGNGI